MHRLALKTFWQRTEKKNHEKTKTVSEECCSKRWAHRHGHSLWACHQLRLALHAIFQCDCNHIGVSLTIAPSLHLRNGSSTSRSLSLSLRLSFNRNECKKKTLHTHTSTRVKPIKRFVRLSVRQTKWIICEKNISGVFQKMQCRLCRGSPPGSALFVYFDYCCRRRRYSSSTIFECICDHPKCIAHNSSPGLCFFSSSRSPVLFFEAPSVWMWTRPRTPFFPFCALALGLSFFFSPFHFHFVRAFYGCKIAISIYRSTATDFSMHSCAPWCVCIGGIRYANACN